MAVATTCGSTRCLVAPQLRAGGPVANAAIATGEAANVDATTVVMTVRFRSARRAWRAAPAPTPAMLAAPTQVAAPAARCSISPTTTTSSTMAIPAATPLIGRRADGVHGRD
jgi:hypothetical protein